MTKSKFNSINTILVYFQNEHLPDHLKQVTVPFEELAHDIVVLANETNIAEVMAGLRKLLEAKDCAVRAALSAQLCECCNKVSGSGDICHYCAEDKRECKDCVGC